MKNKNYISSLTSLRGIAALLVIFFHIDLICFRLADPEAHFFIRKGYLWVDFFFILSGFIMVHVYGKYFSKKLSFNNFKEFIKARFARIYPLHLFAFLCMILLFLWYRTNNEINVINVHIFSLKAIPTNLLLLQSMGFHDYLNWNTPSWSISTEWWVYTIFPVLMSLYSNFIIKNKTLTFLGIIAGYLFIFFYLHPVSNASSPFPSVNGIYSLDVTYDYGFLRCLLGFSFGMLVYELYKTAWLKAALENTKILLILTFLTLVLLSFDAADLFAVVLFALILLACAFNEGSGKSFLNSRPLLFLGNISYSLYLMQMLVIFFVIILARTYSFMMPGRNASWIVLWSYCLLYVLAIILVSKFTYSFIEVPFRKKLNRKK